MRDRRCHIVGLVIFLGIGLGCSQSDRQKAQEEADRAAAKTQELARKAGEKAKAAGQDVAAQIKTNSTDEAQAKLENGAQELKRAGKSAAVKLDKASMVARIKARLANDVGLKTVSTIEVEANGASVTLAGTVSSLEQKQAAERSALAVPGVEKVHNELRVEQP